MDPEKKLLETSDRIRKAMFEGDVETLDMLLDRDYRSHAINGDVESRDTVLSAYGPGGARLDEYRTTEMEVVVSGEVGIMSGRGYLSGYWGDYRFEHDMRFTDIYFMRDGGWRLYLSHGTEIAGNGAERAEDTESS